MTLTTPTVHVPDANVSIPGWVRRHLAWMLIAVAVFATAVLVTFTVVDDGSSTDVVPHGQIFDQGSITALDHRSAPAPAARSLLDGSITATEHRAGR